MLQTGQHTQEELQVLITTFDGKTVKLWDARTVKGGYRVAVLPRFFDTEPIYGQQNIDVSKFKCLRAQIMDMYLSGQTASPQPLAL